MATTQPATANHNAGCLTSGGADATGIMMGTGTGGLTAAEVASTEKEFKATCPVSGKPAIEKAVLELPKGGGKVYFCCENCPKAFQADSAKYSGKANHQLVQSGQLEQVKCPLTGRPMAADKTVDVSGVKVALCCGNCLKKAQGVSGDELVNLLFKDTSKGYKAASK